MRTKLKVIASLIMIGLIIMMYFRIENLEGKLSEQIDQSAQVPDTIRKEFHYYHSKDPVNAPLIIYVKPEKDTTLRKKAEKSPIIIGEKITPTGIDIQKIDSTGKVTQEHHKITPGSAVTIDTAGMVHEKKKTRTGRILQKAWKGTKTGLTVVGGIAIAVIAAKNL
jgi:hypothetical protein